MAPLQFGILLYSFQPTDMTGPIDILECCSKKIIGALASSGTPIANISTIDKAISAEFHYIGVDHSPVTLSSGLKVLPTTTVADCPPLDYLMVGGPDISDFTLGEPFTKFIQAFMGDLSAGTGSAKGLFATCTGAYVIASTGTLNGKRATTNQAAIPLARLHFPEVLWEEKQWVVDGKIWTAGGACAGMDMIAHWVMENYGEEVARAGFYLLDFEPRNVDGGLVLERQHGVVA